ncbi:SAM-dependent methyltransferase [Amycolatopsis sp. MEPSY49]|uniref:SAM-dependent methyltransferase n=1 Tax=Amycolatopsis sp. MEPSY49 TaxID=3151600 RepID=UPI003EF94CFA
MDDELNALRRTRMRWNTPLSEAHASVLLDRLDLGEGPHLVDLGCGWGELLLRASERAPALRVTGVDADEVALARGRSAARERGLAVEFTSSDAATWDTPVERAFCIGAAHVFGSTKAGLAGLARVVPSGRLLYGDGFWAAPPNPAALEIFGPDTLTLPELVDTAADAGWRVRHLSVADQLEWDDFESTSRAGWEEWLAAHPADPRAGEVREWLDRRLREYVRDYRGVLGLAYLVLTR